MTSLPLLLSAATSAPSDASQSRFHRARCGIDQQRRADLHDDELGAGEVIAHGAQLCAASPCRVPFPRDFSTVAASAVSTASTPSPETPDITNTFWPQAFSSARASCREHRLWDRVDLVQRHDLRLVRQAVAIGFELGADGLVGAHDRRFGAVDQMQDHARAFGMAEEAIAKPGAFMRAFDQAREDRRARNRCPRRAPRRAAARAW